jgi:glycosyltransferase involved in cell wall biosynthesis
VTDRHYCIIGSMGRTATHWIAKSLNCHSDVFIVHGFDFDPRKDLAEEVAEAEARIGGGGVDLTAFVQDEEHHDRYFDLIEKIGDYRVYGTIHSVLPVFAPGVVPRRKFERSCIVRDPIYRAESFLRKGRKQEVVPYLDNPGASSLQHFAESRREKLAEDAAIYGFDPEDLNVLLFLRTIETILFFDRHLAEQVRVFRMEDLVADSQKFDEFFRFITGLDPDSDPLFRSRKSAIDVQDNMVPLTASADDVIWGWRPWQVRYMLGELLRLGMRKFYEDLGYDLSPLDRAHARNLGRESSPVVVSIPKVSIIMFVRNRADMVARAIDSVLDQGYPDLQFVIQDGASTDGTVDVVRSYGDQVELVSQPDRGTNEGFWRGLQRARGDIIGTCLSDEEMMPGTIRRAVEEFSRRPRAGAITGDAVVADVHGNTVGFHAGGEFNLLSYLLGDYCPHFATSYFRRQALEDVGFYSDRWKDGDLDTVEFEIWCRLGLQSVIDYVPHLFARWTVHDQQMSQNIDRIAGELASRTMLIDRHLFGEGKFFGDSQDLRDFIIRRQHDIIIYHLLAHGQREDARRIEEMRLAALGPEKAGPRMTDVDGLPAPPNQFSEAEKIHRGRLFHDMAMRYRDRGQVDEALRAWKGVDILNDETIDAMQPQLALASPTITDAELEQRQTAWAHKYAHPTLLRLDVPLKKIEPGKKLTVAYNSTLWNIQTGLAILMPVMAAHDRGRIRLIGYSHLDQPPEIREKFDEFYETGPMNHGGFAEMVRRHQVDILVETNGLSYGNRLPAMAARCAPIQVSYVNHAGTLTVPNIDYVITDSCTAGSMNQGFYTERHFILPSCFLSYTYSGMWAPPCAPAPFDANGYVTFGCFGGPYKLNIDCLRLWAGALHAVPDSRLILQNPGMDNAGNADFIRRRFSRLGIDEGRVTILPGATREEVLENYKLMDISLDSWPYCGGNTIAEALWQGVPVVTLKGNRFVSAYGASLLEAAGIGDLVGTSPEEFAAICARLAGAPVRLRELRENLRGMMMDNGLSNPWRMARALEDAYSEMARRACL